MSQDWTNKLGLIEGQRRFKKRFNWLNGKHDNLVASSTPQLVNPENHQGGI